MLIRICIILLISIMLPGLHDRFDVARGTVNRFPILLQRVTHYCVVEEFQPTEDIIDACITKETFIHDFLVILKLMFQNY